MPEIAVTILGITGLLALVSLLPPVANRLNLPFSVLLALAGCALGVVVFFGQNLPGTGLLGDFVAALRGFEISPESNHAVSTVHAGERFTLVYSFYRQRERE